MKNDAIRFEHAGALARTIGSDAHGLTDRECAALGKETAEIVGRLNAARAKTPYRDLPHNKKISQCDEVLASARAKKGKFDDLVVLGIGGSALGLTALATALCPPYWNLLPREKRGGRPRLWVMDNVDPAEFAALLDIVDTERTLFNVISKSGSTAETMSQFLIALDLLKDCVGADWKKHLVVTTDAKTGILRPFVQAEGLESFAVPDGVGGRFSVLSPVGLFGAATVGIDVEALLAGAAAMDSRASTAAFDVNPAAQGAAVQIGLYRKGKPMSVMMPYSAALRDVADWFRQLWAESLGKTRADGSQVGPTPINALGVTDQHSQVQLYRDGPNDKVFTVLAVEDFGTEVPIPQPPAGVAGIEYLAGHSMAELMHAEERATVWALARLSQRPTVRLVLERITPHAVGQLLYLLEVQTSIAGEMLGASTYTQPGVEAGKEATRALMSAEGPIKNPAAKGLPAEAATYAALRKRIEAD
jgi:glucose-6-phosphate isomerase